MYKKLIYLSMVFLFLLATGGALFAQESTKGTVSGTVEDKTGGVIPGVRVILSGPQGTKEAVTDDRGSYVFTNLTPGIYSVRAEMTAFKAAEAKNIDVRVNERRDVRLVLEPGAPTETVEVAGVGTQVDVTSTTIGANLDEKLYASVPLSRNLASIWYLAPGVSDGLGTGQQNPSISGATGLENMTLVDGVNLTNSEFGAVGTYNRVYGGLGTGLNFDFIKEVQIQTGGFDARYGQALGGVVNVVTKSGGNEVHGGVYGYFQPRWSEAGRKLADSRLVNKIGDNSGRADYDVVAEAGGYVVKDKFFWYGSFNPTWGRDFFKGAFQLADRGVFQLRDRKLNMTGKLTYNITNNHLVEGTYTADPSRRPRTHQRVLGFDSVTGDLTEGDSELEYGSRNIVGRYNGTFSPRWVVAASAGRVFNKFDEVNYNNSLYRIDNFYPNDDAALRMARLPRRIMGSIGFFENSRNANNQFNLTSSHNLSTLGKHQVDYGYQFEDVVSDTFVARTGPSWALFPAGPVRPVHVGRPNFGAQLRIRRASGADAAASPGLNVGDPIYQQIRGSFSPNPPITKTDARYHSFFLQDAWSPSRYFNVKAGVRWEQQQLRGDPNSLDINSIVLDELPANLRTREALIRAQRYTFTGNWAPRIGFTIDPKGQGKTKIFANYGVVFEKIPLDLAIRSLSVESSYIGMRFRPDPGSVTINRMTGQATITRPPVLDQAHYIRGGFLNGGFTAIVPGTQSQKQREFLAGFEHTVGKNIVVGARYVHRELTRIVEDMSGLTVQAAAGDGDTLDQIYLIGNPGPQTDIFHNAICTNPVGNMCLPRVGPDGRPIPGSGWAPGSGQPGSDGIPDGFVKPIRRYQALEITVEKRFSDNWQLHSNWRISRLKGNYEGNFRNDNGQQDPNISSLFDFVSSPQLGDQFAIGPLNSDRRHVVNLFLSRVFLAGLNVGVGTRLQSGIPFNSLLSHPAYQNAGEVPIGGRGRVCTAFADDTTTDPVTTRCTSSFEQRSPVSTDVNLHVDYTWKLNDRVRVRPILDIFNLFNQKKELRRDQFIEFGPGLPNADFRQPRTENYPYYPFQRPFYARFAVRLEF
jgi:hypothetical protein